MKKQPPVTKYDRLSYLLGAYGSGAMNEEQFWSQMKQSRLGHDDIDAWCDEFWSRRSKTP